MTLQDILKLTMVENPIDLEQEALISCAEAQFRRAISYIAASGSNGKASISIEIGLDVRQGQLFWSGNIKSKLPKNKNKKVTFGYCDEEGNIYREEPGQLTLTLVHEQKNEIEQLKQKKAGN